jgi:ParB/RepB/Spo0J family partition protein
MKLTVIPASEIHFGDRFRKEMGDIDKLANSLKKNGFINPITVQARDDLPEPARYLLLAGGRRFTAANVADITDIPVRIYDRALSEDELRAIELEENIQRKDLHWMEKGELEDEIHELQKRIHGEKTSTLPDAPGHSMRDTAKLLGRSIGSVSMDIKLAKMVKQLPDLEWGKCRTKAEGMKLLNRVEETMLKRELATRAEAIIAPPNGLRTQDARDHRKKQLIDSYIIGDFFDKSKSLEPESYNFVEIDPPYGIDLQAIKRRGHGVSVWDYSEQGYNEINAEHYQVFLAELFARCYKLMSQHSWLVCWFAPEPWFDVVYQELCNAGFSTNRQVGVWTKDQGQTMNPNIRLGSAYEPFFWAWKGSPTLGKPGSLNVFHQTPIAGRSKVHPTERPLPLMTRIMETFAFANSKVLVPFAGSGVSLLAAHSLKMHPVGYDLSQQYKDSYILKVMEGEF